MAYLMNFLAIAILTVSIPLQAMKRTREAENQAIEKTIEQRKKDDGWEYDISFLDGCTLGRNRPRIAYFLPESNQDLSEEFTTALIKKSKEKLDINEPDVLDLKKDQKQTLWYILNYVYGNTIIIEEPEEFSRRMSQNILDLPLPIRQKITQKYGETMKASIHHKLLCGAICLDDEENKEKCVSCMAKLTCCFSLCLTGFRMWLKKNYPYSLGTVPPLALILHHIYKNNHHLLYNMIHYNYNLHLFRETAEEKERRLSLVEISLLQEMKCEIVEK